MVCENTSNKGKKLGLTTLLKKLLIEVPLGLKAIGLNYINNH